MTNFELIDKYINNELSAEEKLAFELSLTQNTELKSDFEFHQNIRKVIENEAHKSIIEKSTKSYKQWIKFKTGLFFTIVIIFIITIVGSIVIFKNNEKKNGKNVNQIQKATSEIGEMVKSILPKSITQIFSKEKVVTENINIDSSLNNKGIIWAEKYLPIQSFNIDNQKDTVIETENGIIVFIPANSCIDLNNENVNGIVEFKIQEAIQPADIILAGLDTRTNGKQLETAGMFKMSAISNGRELKMNPNKYITTQIPTLKRNPDMQLYSGEIENNGNINWVNPKPIENWLTPVDMSLLDFIPNLYKKNAHNIEGFIYQKSIVDSLYFSYVKSNHRNINAIAWSNGIVMNRDDPFIENLINQLNLSEDSTYDLIFKKDKKNQIECKKGRGYARYTGDNIKASLKTNNNYINPSSIKAIWNKKFNNTNLATREFERRLQLIHKSCNQAILDLYIKNLDKNLYELDFYATKYVDGSLKKQFIDFANLKEGKVKNNGIDFQKLQAYYLNRFKAAQKLAQSRYQAEIQLEIQFQRKKESHNQIHRERELDVLNQEISQNEYNIKKQWGLNPKVPTREILRKPQNVEYYTARVSSFGWKNIDMLTSIRQTFSLTNEKGKKATIVYTPLTIKLNESQKYDRVMAYLLSDKINSYLLFKKSNNVFKQSLNESFVNNVLVIGFKNQQLSLFEKSNIKGDTLLQNIKLDEIEKSALKKYLNNKYQKQANLDLNEDIDFQQIDIEYNKPKIAKDKLNRIKNLLYQFAFPCEEQEGVKDSFRTEEIKTIPGYDDE